MRNISRTAWLVVINVLTLACMTTLAVVKLLPEHSPPQPGIEKTDGPYMPVLPRQTFIGDIQQAPLFNPSRQPLAEASAVSSQSTAAIAEPPVLIGVLGEGGVLRALMEDASSNTRKLLQRGDVFIGWTLVSVDSKKAELQAAGRKVVLDLSAPHSVPNPNNVIDTQAKTIQ